MSYKANVRRRKLILPRTPLIHSYVRSPAASDLKTLPAQTKKLRPPQKIYSAPAGRSLGHQQTSCYVANLAGDKTCMQRGEIKDDIRHFFRAAKPAHWRLLYPALVCVRPDGLHHRGVDAPRRNGVDANVIRAEFAREMAREADHRCFCGRVVNADDVHVGPPSHGGHVDDRPGLVGAHSRAE